MVPAVVDLKPLAEIIWQVAAEVQQDILLMAAMAAMGTAATAVMAVRAATALAKVMKAPPARMPQCLRLPRKMP